MRLTSFIKAADGNLSFTVTWVSDGGKETLSVAGRGVFRGPEWFVLVESPGRIWMFDGVGQVDLVTSRPGQIGRYSINHPGIPETCPGEVRDALSPSLRESLKKKTPE